MRKIKILDSLIEYKTLCHEDECNPQNNILYIHGFGGDLSRIIELSERFVEYNIWGLNLPFSEITAENENKHLNLFYYSAIINEFIDTLKIPNVIGFGHSMGGGVLALAMNQKSQNFKTGIFVAPINKTSCNLKELFLEGFYPETLTARIEFLDKVFYDATKFKNNPLVIDKALKYVENLKNDKAFSRKLKKLGAHLISDEVMNGIEKSLNRIEKNTLLIYGDSDNIIDLNNIYSYYQKNLKNHQTIIVPKSGHAPWEENPDFFFESVKKFLTKNK
ncbi:alpha/beta hydrolase [Mycoplasma iguanae]|uniref:Alpha/beta hydrolase n=1 Tax=Mycoplasma iguanae TaxID=292461 RepID=A0ABY5RA57_9MOLU|nr:alpha/beta hydrolase [Mycoplasma iguanae]UVD81875.1 alpha/beta hydrolase [Mycoplasma iguanae]